jgi:hypothetical protein
LYTSRNKQLYTWGETIHKKYKNTEHKKRKKNIKNKKTNIRGIIRKHKTIN